MVSRRQFLSGFVSSSVVVSSAGCVGTRWWEDENDTRESTDSEESDDEPAPDAGSSTDAASDETSEEESTETASDNESEQSADSEDRQHEPDEEDLEVDEDKYEDHGTSETEQRSTADIEIDADADLENNGGARVSGTVTNVSETSIDVVDLEFTFYDAGGNYLTADLVSVRDLEAGDSESFESTITPDQARGQPDYINIEPTVYDRAD